MSMPSQKGPSILGTAARFRAPPRGMLFGTLGNPRLVGASLSEAENRAVRERLAPIITSLNQQRQVWFDTTEQQLRLKMAGAGVAGLVLGWLLMGSVLIGLTLMVGGALFAFLIVGPKADEIARAQTKHAIVNAMADELLDLTSVPPEARASAFSKDRVEGWRLLPRVRTITVDDRLVGAGEGFEIAVSRVGFQFGGSANVELKQGDGLVFVIVEIAQPGAGHQLGGPVTIFVGTDAPVMLKSAPQITHGLAKFATGDEAFDGLYSVYGEPRPVTPNFRAGFAAIEAVARCDKTGTREVAPGTGLRPAVIFSPARLLVLTPVPVFDGALEPPPIWEPLDARDLVPAFASDLAVLNDHLNAALELRSEISWTHATTRGIQR